MIDLSSIAAGLGGRPVAVFGLGLSGLATVSAFVRAGVSVTAWDDDETKRTQAASEGATITNLTLADLSGFAMLVVAPGIPLTHPEPHVVVARAQEFGVEILGDVELLHRVHHGRKTIGITGTNGKSTTTALIGHVLNANGITASVGGNIGRAALDIELPPQDGVIVLELSSYQLDLCPTFAPDIGVHMNLTPDHLDRHGDMAGYAAAKMRIFRGAGAAIIGVDDEPSRAMFKQVQEAGDRDVYAISVVNPVERGAYVSNGILFDCMDGEAREIGSVSALTTLPGVHNHQNICAAYIAARLSGLDADVIMNAVKTYPGLPHRQFMTRVINGVAYVNDSKATNADATAKALVCYRNICWIVGGKPKDGGLNGLEPFMDRVRKAFVIGAAMDDFCKWLDNRGVDYVRSETLDRAVSEAHITAQAARGEPGGAGVVLLSPACASFDQFRSFEHRGDEFTKMVMALPEGDKT